MCQGKTGKKMQLAQGFVRFAAMTNRQVLISVMKSSPQHIDALGNQRDRRLTDALNKRLAG